LYAYLVSPICGFRPNPRPCVTFRDVLVMHQADGAPS
jgi:hypothetical protein